MDHTSIGFTIYILTLAFVFGTVLGSFIDCMAWRIVKQESVLKGRSHCDVCGAQLTAGDPYSIVFKIRWKMQSLRCKDKPGVNMGRILFGFDLRSTGSEI